MKPSIFESDRYKLLLKLPDSYVNQVKFTDNGMAFIQDGHSIKPLGCLNCYNETPELNELGVPVLKGRQMLGYEDVKLTTSENSLEVLSNLWFCPWCEKMHTELLPKFM